MSQGGATWLQVSAPITPGDTRSVVGQTLGPTWGLHLVDVNIALGDLVDLARTESAAYVARRMTGAAAQPLKLGRPGGCRRGGGGRHHRRRPVVDGGEVEILGGLGEADGVALGDVAAGRGQEAEVVGALDALGHHPQAE